MQAGKFYRVGNLLLFCCQNGNKLPKRQQATTAAHVWRGKAESQLCHPYIIVRHQLDNPRPRSDVPEGSASCTGNYYYVCVSYEYTRIVPTRFYHACCWWCALCEVGTLMSHQIYVLDINFVPSGQYRGVVFDLRHTVFLIQVSTLFRQ